jgi:hypothetical protein
MMRDFVSGRQTGISDLKFQISNLRKTKVVVAYLTDPQWQRAAATAVIQPR